MNGPRRGYVRDVDMVVPFTREIEMDEDGGPKVSVWLVDLENVEEEFWRKTLGEKDDPEQRDIIRKQGLAVRSERIQFIDEAETGWREQRAEGTEGPSESERLPRQTEAVSGPLPESAGSADAREFRNTFFQKLIGTRRREGPEPMPSRRAAQPPRLRPRPRPSSGLAMTSLSKETRDELEVLAREYREAGHEEIAMAFEQLASGAGAGIREGEASSYFEDVKTFHRMFHEPPEKVTWLDGKRWASRVRLINEEWSELTTAYAKEDVNKFADSLADLVWVVLGTAVEAGMPFDALWREVRRANMEKRGAAVDRSGKLGKPEGWRPPDIESILDTTREGSG